MKKSGINVLSNAQPYVKEKCHQRALHSDGHIYYLYRCHIK